MGASQHPSLFPEGRPRRSFWILVVVVLAAAAMGVLTGTRAPQKRDPFIDAQRDSAASGEAARSYAELRLGRRGPNGAIYSDAFERLRQAGPGLLDPIEPQTEADRQAALAARADRRAYAGAPPVVPHAIDQRSPGACLSCHETGATIGGKVAPAMSHERFPVCVQCHAAAKTSVPAVDVPPSVAVETTFAGSSEPGPGQVAWEGAPPTIPHSTLMRENCSSCHGPLGKHGLRTPHPVRTSCTQCHASGSSFDPGRAPQ